MALVDPATFRTGVCPVLRRAKPGEGKLPTQFGRSPASRNTAGGPSLAAARWVPAGRRLVGHERRHLTAGLLALTLASTTLGACAAGEVLRPVERSQVQPGGPRRVAPLAAGDPVPAFVTPRLGGGVVRWRDRDGSPTVLVVWASWCPHCQRLLPPLIRVARDFPAVQVLTVTTSIGRYAGPSPQEFVEQHGLAAPVALDDSANTLARALGVVRYPTVYWVGRDGAVRAVSEGEATDVALRHAFQQLLAGTL